MYSVDDLNKLLRAEEALCPELQAWMEEEGPLGAPCIRHPLVYSIFHTPCV